MKLEIRKCNSEIRKYNKFLEKLVYTIAVIFI